MNERELVLDILIEILEKGAYSHVILGQALEKYQYLSKQERAFITRTVKGTLEYLIPIDWVLDEYSCIKTKKMKPVIRTILRMSVYQILYMDQIPDSATCNEGVRLAEKRKFTGLKGFVNGVLRTIAREKETIKTAIFQTPAARLALPSWLSYMWERELGVKQTERIAAAFLRERATAVRCNLNLASRETIIGSLKKQGVSWSPSDYSEKVLELSEYDHLECLEAFQNGWIQVQDLSSVFAGDGAAPKMSDYVIDVCAAPGGKSLHMAELLKGSGMVEARDLSRKKVELIQENIRRSGYSNICASVQDARKFHPESVGKADILLADLPCSGLGVIGKKPDIKLHMNPEKIGELVGLQQEILSVVWQYVKPGGTLVYSTCTISRAENQENVDWFLARYPFERVDITGRFGPGVQEESLREGWMQFLPSDYPCDGFFVAVLRRVP